jgi:hypothetical protein
MLIVGLAAAAMAITVYYVWFLAKRGRELWRDRNAEKLIARRKTAAPAGRARGQ